MVDIEQICWWSRFPHMIDYQSADNPDFNYWLREFKKNISQMNS